MSSDLAKYPVQMKPPTKGLLNESKKDVQLYFPWRTQIFSETSSKVSLLSFPLTFSHSFFLSSVEWHESQ